MWSNTLKKSNLILMILFIATTFISFYLKQKLDQERLISSELIKEVEKLSVQTVEIQDTLTTLKFHYNTLLTQNLSLLKHSISLDSAFDTIIVVKNDTIIVGDTLVDTIFIPRETWGTIEFSDTSNIFTDLDVIVDFPYGRRTIQYTNKYKIKPFKKYIGIGVQNNNLSLSGDVFIYNVGLGVTISKKSVGAYIKWQLP